MALGALDAMREAGRPIPIVDLNTTPEGMAAIKAGELLAPAVRRQEIGVETGMGVRGVRGKRGHLPRPSLKLSHRTIFHCDAQRDWAFSGQLRDFEEALANERDLGCSG